MRDKRLALVLCPMVSMAVCHAEERPVTVAPGEEVVVTATRTEKSVLDVPASVRVIARNEIEAAGAVQVDELLKNVAGVDLQGSGFPGAAIKLNLRGLTPGYQSKRVLVLIDGRRVNDSYQGNAEFALLPADSIERIEILRGPASALYGSNAMGGVINIVTRRGRETPVTELRAAAGSYGTQHYRFGRGARSGSVDYFVSGSHVQTDGYADNSDGTDRDWTARNLDGNVGWAIGEHAEVRVHFGGYRGEGTDENSDRESHRDYQVAEYAWNWSERRDAKLLVRAYRNAERHEYDWKYPGEGIYRQMTRAAELQQSLWADDRHLVTFGGELRRESVDIDETTGPIDESTSLLAAYVQDEVHLSDAVQVTAGLRLDHVDDFGSEWSPHAGLLWRVTEAMEAFAAANRAHRAPALSDRYVKTEYNGALFVGNPDLKPETLTAYEAGVRRRFGDRIRTELTVFHSRMKDSFDFMLDEDGVFRNRNASRTTIRGVESSVRCRLAHGLEGFAYYTYTDGEYDEFPAGPDVEGNTLAYLAPHKAGLGLEYRDGEGASHGLLGRYVGQRYGDARNTAAQRMDARVTVDWRSRVPLGETFVLTLNVDNILDESYEDFPGVKQAPTTFLVGLEASF